MYSQVVGLMGKAIGDFVEGEFKLNYNINENNAQDMVENLDETYNFLGGSLIVNSCCRSACLLAGFNIDNHKNLLDFVFKLGNHIYIWVLLLRLLSF